MLAALNLRSEATALPRGQPPMCGVVGVLSTGLAAALEQCLGVLSRGTLQLAPITSRDFLSLSRRVHSLS